MKTTFFENNPLTSVEIENLWKDATFIFDTNILLNLYRYSDETSKEFIDTIAKLGNRIWIPYQVGLEFHRNRLDVITEQKNYYENFQKEVNKIVALVENKNRSPFLSESLFGKLVVTKDEINIEVDEKIRLLDERITNDLVLSEINSIFDGRIGKPFDNAEFNQIFVEGKDRYDKKIPPGYCDIKKSEDTRYGDLIFWKQILLKSKNDGIDVVLIIDDRKEDWWLEHHGKTVSPRPELLREFRSDTHKMCHFYKPFQFLKYANQYLGSDIKKEVIEEVKNYKSVTDQKGDSIIVQWILKGTSESVDSMVYEMEKEGYSINKSYYASSDIYVVNIFLPNIPDLERRLTAKYQSVLSEKNISLVESETLHQVLIAT